jgi:tRNA-specific 2-thiouridylase
VSCEIEDLGSGEVRARLAEAVMGVAPGQSAVFYKGDRVVGGGVVR